MSLRMRPVGTPEKQPVQPSLRDLESFDLDPSAETLGYSHPSLRDEEPQILAALNRNARAPFLANGNSGYSLVCLLLSRPVKSKHPDSLAAQARSESTEDHLERIQELVDQKGYARVADIAGSLGLSTSAVSNMVRRLAARGYVNYEKYRGFTLTSEGQAVANHIKVRHETLTALLQLLGLSPPTVQEEVEDIEHHLKPETLRVFSKLVQFWLSNPKQLRKFLDFSKRK